MKELPDHPGLDENVPHAPKRVHGLDSEEIQQALSNALRYFDRESHDQLQQEFLEELNDYGHIYMYRYRPTQIPIKAYPVNLYPCKTKQAACMMHQIMNNLGKAEVLASRMDKVLLSPYYYVQIARESS